MDQVLYIAFAAVALVAALLAVTRKNAVAAACWLVIMFFGLAGIFVLMEAYFVAAVQILVYAGAIMVLFLFVIMLLDLRSAELKAHAGPSLKLGGVLLAGVFFGAVVYAVSDAAASSKTADRVSAVLRLPAPPPPPPSDDPLKPTPPLPQAPAPIAIELSETAPADFQTSSSGVVKLRVYHGAVALATKSHDFMALVDGWGPPMLSWDGKPLDFRADAPPGHFSIPMTSDTGAPAGSVLDVSVQRGGLEASAGGGPDGSPKAIGKALFEVWLLPFEITSLLLTGAIFGAVILTKRRLS